MIQFFQVTKRYPGRPVRPRRVNFDIPRGQFVFLTGASGRRQDDAAAADLPRGGADRRPDPGQRPERLLDPPGKIPYLRRTIGVVFQDFRLIHRKTVFENVTYLPRSWV